MRQVLLNSLPMHEPEKVCPPVFFIVHSRELLCSQATAELRSVWTAGGGCPYATPGRATAPVPTRADHSSGSLRFRL